MEDLFPILFLLVSFIYSSVGMGGGSSYTAIMAIFGMNYNLIPINSLFLNLCVTFVGTLNFWRSGHGRINLVGPFLITSIPMAFIAGFLNLPEIIFQTILILAFLIFIIRIFIFDRLTITYQLSKAQKWITTICFGSLLGFICGSVGIGGGICLIPLIIIFGLGSAKEASAAGAMFILVNSIASIVPRIMIGEYDIIPIIPMVVAVLIGGITGSYMGSVRFDKRTIERITGGILILAIFFSIYRIL